MRRWRFWIAVGLLGTGVAVMLAAGWQWRRISLDAEAAAAVARGVPPPPDAGVAARLAWAARLGRKGRHEEALEIYSVLLETAPPHLMPWVHHGLGDLYLRRAREEVERTAFDEALPLVALAKQSYRRALRLDPGLWAARYNLEAALRLLPEIERLEMKRKEGKEAAKEALWSRVPGFPRGLP